ncbi:TetR/AcrR family transcriptional regulator [Amycolatopsis suaedae]|uniref:TetR/AcrR family transcriptional regulator n=1 Tax=Amycolatopsis suaedae TaxID=2510978 RepID=A0A4Q7J4I7_9PSEU|nr:TetR family transcriptional regulator [Amycolatopsis suaedae]RZQ62481.1 TetR/AcrR family transcriptional regulator [Amycolatopsis suaedae]
MGTFKRAHSEEQRSERRRVILDTAAAMLTEMPVAQLSLNALSRRVCLAKSNVLRYFESREAVLLELLDVHLGKWLAEVDADLTVDEDAGVRERAIRLVGVLATTLSRHPVLCDLMAAQASVLERNVSPEAVLRHKRSTLKRVEVLRDLVVRAVPELGNEGAERFALAAALTVSALWPHSQPSPALLAAYAAEPGLARMRIEFVPAVRELLETLLAGMLAR